MKKALYILLIISSMGFAVSPETQSQPEPGKKRIIEHSAVQTGYLEVNNSTSYTLNLR